MIDLRKNDFDVVVYDDELARHFQKEADFMAELNKKAAQEGSVTDQREKDMQKWIPQRFRSRYCDPVVKVSGAYFRRCDLCLN